VRDVGNSVGWKEVTKTCRREPLLFWLPIPPKSNSATTGVNPSGWGTAPGYLIDDELLRKWTGKPPTHVFSLHGKPIIQVSTKAWYAGLKRAGIVERFRWHDLRHTWASWHVQAGTPLFALQEMGGWSSAEMVRRMRTWRRNTWHPMRIAFVHCGPWSRKATAQIRHKPENENGLPEGKPLNCWLRGQDLNL